MSRKCNATANNAPTGILTLRNAEQVTCVLPGQDSIKLTPMRYEVVSSSGKVFVKCLFSLAEIERELMYNRGCFDATKKVKSIMAKRETPIEYMVDYKVVQGCVRKTVHSDAENILSVLEKYKFKSDVSSRKIRCESLIEYLRFFQNEIITLEDMDLLLNVSGKEKYECEVTKKSETVADAKQLESHKSDESASDTTCKEEVKQKLITNGTLIYKMYQKYYDGAQAIIRYDELERRNDELVKQKEAIDEECEGIEKRLYELKDRAEKIYEEYERNAKEMVECGQKIVKSPWYDVMKDSRDNKR